MKKFVLPFFSLLLVLSLALSSFSSVTAAGGGDPWVTPVSGDMEFTATIVPIASLPGVIELPSQMLAPAGFPAGETQFGGNGVRVTEFETGKATACFSLSAQEVKKGWGGKVGMWDGAKWVLLPTTIAPVAEEASFTSACAGITGNGTYAFIKYIADAALLSSYGQCPFEVMAFPIEPDLEVGRGFSLTALLPSYDLLMEAALVFTSNGYTVPVGGTVSYKILSSIPPGFILAGGSGSGIVEMSAPGAMFVMFDPPVIINWDDDLEDDFEDLTVRIFFPDCYADFNFSGFFFPPVLN